MENIENSDPKSKDAENQVTEEEITENSKNTGSSEVDTKVHQPERNYGRTTDTTGVGHEPGTVPGVGI